MQAPCPPLVLIFGPYDPSGASSLPADAVTCASLGCHPLSTVTAILVQDTAGVEDIQPVSPELIDDQARCLLEDMKVQAIKVGPIYTTESASVLAQIAADYSHVPLVLHLDRLPDESLAEDLHTEDVLLAVCELLLPQTDLVVIDHNLLAQWHTEGVFEDSDAESPTDALLEYGAKWVLSTGAPLRPGHYSHSLRGQSGETGDWPWQPPTTRLTDPDSLLSCAITTQLAHGLPMQAAVANAIALCGNAAARWLQPGMGHRLIDRTTP
ncbi:bifunctional hydroxymethylpyrimidine kinase/phosphomethylpyrimidine kinase [Alcaligenaceae bacterium]|nr:bifunctional hydroxymethylpyrimidine kinase/phosphomethylpyrimidine kinase [Alcaligenaceae bacterium]